MNVTQFWQWGSQQQYEETVIEITTTQPNQTFEWFVVVGNVHYYDWDNGVRTNSKLHTFSKAGVYTIKIVGNIKRLRVTYEYLTNFLVTKIIKVAKTIDDFSYCFSYCINITSIPSGLFDKNVNAVSFRDCFSNCTNLTSIPSELFDKNVNVVDFSACFCDCLKLANRPTPHGLEMWEIGGTNGRPSNTSVIIMFRNCIAMSDFASLPFLVR